jgi:hypothetical protein
MLVSMTRMRMKCAISDFASTAPIFGCTWSAKSAASRCKRCWDSASCLSEAVRFKAVAIAVPLGRNIGRCRRKDSRCIGRCVLLLTTQITRLVELGKYVCAYQRSGEQGGR